MHSLYLRGYIDKGPSAHISEAACVSKQNRLIMNQLATTDPCPQMGSAATGIADTHIDKELSAHIAEVACVSKQNRLRMNQLTKTDPCP